MRRTALAAVLVSGLVAAPAAAGPAVFVSAYVVVPAAALVNATGAEAYGLTCGMVTVSDAPGSQTGIVVGAAVTVPATNVDVTCTVQVGTLNDTHDKPDAASLTRSGNGVVVVADLISYAAPEDADVYLCTKWRMAGVDYFYDAAAKVFSTSGTVECVLATSQELDAPLAAVADPIACPLLALALPPHGDVPAVWDCPPYDD